MADSDKPSPREDSKPTDVVLVHGRSEDGEGIRVLRTRNGELFSGELRALKHGVPVGSGEIVTLTQRAEHPLLFDVNTQLQLPEGTATSERPGHAGPARVSSDAYRANYDTIFKRQGYDPAIN